MRLPSLPTVPRFPSAALSGGIGGEGPGPEPEFARTALTNTTRSIHSGHSLTDAYTYGNGWPGDLVRLRNSLMEPEDFDSVYIARSTIPGSPMSWRWDNPTTIDARVDIGDFDALMITEAGPPPRTTSEFMVDTLDYLCRFTANTIESGAGQEVILWSIWPALNGPGTTPENPTPTGDWAGFTFRTGLDEYWRSFKMMADYATWKMHQLYDLPSDWRVWLFPGDRWMARVYDDIQLGLVPGITDIAQLFGDDIHPENRASYGLGCFVLSGLYQIDLRTRSGVYVPDGMPTALRDYFWQIAWELATEYEPVGMGGTEGAALIWDSAVDEDPMPDWTLEDPNTGGGGGPDPEPGELPEFALTATAADFSDLSGLSGTQPTAEDGVLKFEGGTSLTGTLDLPAAQYGVMAVQAQAIPSASGPLVATSTDATWWNGDFFAAFFNGYLFGGHLVAVSAGDTADSGVCGTEWVVFEWWTDGETIWSQLNGGSPVSETLTAALTGTDYITMFGNIDGTPDCHVAALGICDHIPTPEDRVAARQWAAGLIPEVQ